MKNLHRITGSAFQRNKPGLCEICAHRRDYGEWEGYCEWRGKILSFSEPRKRMPRCDDFIDATEPGGSIGHSRAVRMT